MAEIDEDAGSLGIATQGNGLTRDQQELVDLLRNELADLVAQDCEILETDDAPARREFLEEQQQHLENIGNAADMVGLHGLRDCCHHLAKNLAQFAASAAAPSEESLPLLQSWGMFLLDYLEAIGDERRALTAAGELLDFLADSAWSIPLAGQESECMMEHFRASNLSVDDDALATLPEVITEDMVRLDLGDAQPQLIQGLLVELPELVRQFEQSIDRYLNSGDMGDLAPAQRLAHTIKGSANVVGIAGAANLMHFMEDLLEAAARSDRPIEGEFPALLQDASDCLAAMADHLAGRGLVPDDTARVMADIVDWVRLFKSGDAFTADEVEPEESSEAMSGQYLLNDALDPFEDDLTELTPAEFGEGAADAWLAEVDAQLSEDGESVAVAEAESSSVIDNHSVGDELADKGLVHNDSSDKKSTDINTADRASTHDEVIEPPATAANPKEDEVSTQQTLVIADSLAQELLRLAGETQIINTQGAAQIDQLAISVKTAGSYHKQIVTMSSELEHLVEVQGALAMAGARQSGDRLDALDPLEMERYNELHSFSHKLLELATDSQEALERMSDQIKTLKTLVLGQQQLNKDNQQLVLQLRMVAVNTMTSRFTRCLRQASRLTGKKAQLVMDGEHILMDSRVLNQVADPIMHLIRNAVDHGLEDPEQRVAAGKPAEGQVRLSFSQAGETIVIRCSDDGRGLDYARIATVAKQRQLGDETFLANPGNLRQLIMMPGFTTRDSVSHTSGRGIGLDAVVEQVRELKGQVSLESDVEDGGGCRFTLVVPSSILSGHAILVRTRGSAGNQILSIVTRSIDQIIHLAESDLQREQTGIFYQQNDEKLPVYELNDLTQIHLHQAELTNQVLLLSHRADGARFGVLVESVIASQDLVIKPLGRFTFKSQGVVGATILGDGAVSPVVDLQELPGTQLGRDELALARVARQRQAERQGIASNQTKPMILVVDDSLSARRSLAQFVTDLGMDVRTAKDGFEAIQVVEQQHPVLMLVDLEMPRMNGLELTAHLRSRPETRTIPIVMITSRSTEKHRRMAATAGVSDYLTKPWSDDALLSAIQGQLQSEPLQSADAGTTM